MSVRVCARPDERVAMCAYVNTCVRMCMCFVTSRHPRAAFAHLFTLHPQLSRLCILMRACVCVRTKLTGIKSKFEIELGRDGTTDAIKREAKR